MKKIRALIVDDEPLARERMRSLLGAEPDVDVVGEARDGIEAVEAILAQSPDLVFLDVHMPKLDGFEVIQTVGSDRMPSPPRGSSILTTSAPRSASSSVA